MGHYALVTKNSIGQRIKNFRLERGWTQEQTAPQLGISLRTLVALERGYKREVRSLTMAKITMALEALSEQVAQ